MPDISRMTTQKLHNLLGSTTKGYLIDEIYDELERRERDLELRDWREQDARAAAEERLELWRREY